MSVPAPERSLSALPSPGSFGGGPPGGESTDLFDYAQVRRQLGFVGRSVRRHRGLVIAVFVLVTALSVALAAVWPRTYHVQTKILAQRNQVMASLGNPHRSMPSEADAPTRAASETVLRRDNLVGLVKQVNLIDNWETTRQPLLHLKDQVMAKLRGAPTDEDKMDALVGLLERRLTVTTGDGTITLGLDWNNGPMSYQLVESAQRNFLEARHVSEVSTIEEAISILEAHAENVHESIERSLEEIQKLQSQPSRPPGVQDPTRVARPRAASSSTSLALGEPAPEEELNRIKFMLRAKRRAIQDLDEFRAKRLAELQNQLAEQRVIYAQEHPVIVDTQQRITALNQESPQVGALKRDVEDLLEEYKRRGGQNSEAMIEPQRAAAAASRSSEGALTFGSRPLEDSPQLSYAKEQLRIAVSTYQDILLRIDAARIELDTARAAFKYRYSVVNPAQLPKKPDRPNVPMMVLAGMMAALGMAIAAAVLADLRRGRFIEAWQVESALGLPVLGEVTLP